nr:reverse transcriptase domain-containing protein [Tanacetum cinerariifolium]
MMVDQRTMAQLLQAPTEGYEDAIVVPAITADNFELKHEPPRSIFTWDDLVSKFINQFFPPFKTTNLRNEITNFQQRFDESFCEAWYRFKDLLRACPHHGFLELHQLDTCYNALNSKDQDSLNSAAGGNFLDKMPHECLAIIESKSKVGYSRNKPVVAKVNKKSQNQAPATVKAVEESCVTCGGVHSYHNCPATNAYQPPAYQAPAPQTQSVSNEDFSAYVKANDAVMRNMQTQGQNMQNQLTNLTELLTKFVNSNNSFTSSSATLTSNTIANPRSDLKAITTRSGVSYDGPQILSSPAFLPKVVENEPEATKDTVHPTNNGSTQDVQPQVVQYKSPILNSEPVNSPIIEPVISLVSAPRPNQRPSIPYPSRMQDQKLRDKANDQREKFFQIFKDLNFNISFVDALILMPKFGPSIKSLLTNKDKLCRMLSPGRSRRKHQSNADKLFLPDLSPTCMTLELTNRSISRPVGVAEDVYVKVDFDADPRVPLILGRSFLKTGRSLIDVFEGELTLRVGKEAITFNLDQTSRYSANYSDMMANQIDVIDMASKYDKSSIDEPLEVELKDLPSHLGYAFLESNDKLPVIIAKYLSVEENTALITVLKSHKRAIAWKLSDIKGIDPEFCTHKILMEEDFEPADQHQRKVNPKIYDVIKQEVLKLLDAGLIYPISDSPWVSLVHYVPKNGGFTVVENEDNELISARLVTGWRVCIDYRKLNETTRKDNFPLPFIDQMLERLAGNQYYCFLDGFSGYFQIPIDPKDQEKTTFTCPYGTFAYRRMPFGLCNAPSMFQSDRGTHFCNDQFAKVMQKFDVTHRLATSYHPQTSGQVEVSNHGLKRILERTLRENRASWSDKLDDVLWTTGDHEKVQLNELNELRDQAYENSLIYKEKTKRLHDSKIKDRVFNIGDRVLLFNSRLKIFSGKLKSCWTGPFTISHVYPYGTVELAQLDGPNFKVNGHRFKHYFGKDVPKMVVLDLQTFPKDH